MTKGRTIAGLILLLAAGMALALVLLPDRGTADQLQPVNAFPGPGDGYASPSTQISLRGRPAHRLGDVEVSGSESGDHAGRLESHSDGQGASFVPDAPFEPGEEVTVRTGLAVRGSDDGEYRFTVARPAAGPKPVVEKPRGDGAIQRFRSEPELQVPAIEVTTRTRAASPGYVFLAPKRGQGKDGLAIVDTRGKLVWARGLSPEGQQAADFRVQRYGGRPVLTWWEGGTNIGTGFGEGVIVDQSYNEVLRVPAGNGYVMDLHEFLLTPRGTALVVIYSFVEADLSPVGGPEDGSVLDGVVQEIDLQTGLVMFEWHTMDHIALDESRQPLPEEEGAPYDYVHLNSVGMDDDGGLLLSGRHSWAVYKVARDTGAIVWRLGGKRSDFELGPDAEFAFQHDVRRREDGAITLFDNAAGPPETREASRAMALELDGETGTARVVDQIEHPDGIIADSQGSAQNLSGGRTFVGWGSQPFFTEHAPDGRVLLAGRLAKGNDNYRAYRGRWTGRPATDPAAVAHEVGGQPV
ncbi:MAG: arylsulfotransferase family protein, partial [Solirubrobacteraceae bacterium]